MPTDLAAVARPLANKRFNPFAVTPASNPLMLTDAVTLVPIPPPVETHEPRASRRNYLAPGGGGGGLDLSDLFKGMRGKRSVPHERAPKDDEDDDHEVPAAPAPRARRG